MIKFKLRTKIEIISAILLLMLLAAISAESLTRTISDSTDTSYTYIRNSNGKYWDATGANLQTAINDLGSGGGTVWVGDDITLTSAIDMNSYTVLDFEGHRVTLGADISFINLSGGNLYNTVRDVRVAVSNGHIKPVIELYLPRGGLWVNRIEYNVFENINIINPSGRSNNDWIGIELNINVNGANPTDMCRIFRNTFKTITISFCNIGILLRSNYNTDAYTTGNYFDNIDIDDFATGVEFRPNAAGTWSGGTNYFNDIKLQTTSQSKDGFKNIGGSNRFTNCFVWDWYAASSPNYEWSISSRAAYTYIASDYLNTEPHDEGISTYITSGNLGHFYDRSPYTYIIYKNTTTTFLQDGKTGFIVDTDTDPQILIDTAISYATNAIIFIKEGTYDVHGYIGSGNMHDITIIGADKTKTIFRATSTLSSGMFNLNGCHNVTFRNICFDGNGQDAIGLFIAFDTSTRGTLVDNCVFRNFNGGSTSTAIYCAAVTSDTVTNIKIINSEFDNNDYGIWLRGDADPSYVVYSDISGNYFGASNTNNILLDYARNCTVSDNRIDSGTWGIILDDSKDCVISNNVISATNGIDEQGGSNFNIITSNNCRLCTTPIDINGAGTIHANTNLGTVS
jgi:parallel beta-helix repeat protein